jgi:hypothetical protein
MSLSTDQIELALGVVLVLLACSFGYKFFNACVLGKCTYWHGFLPITVISPLLVHVPPSKRSLVRTAEGVWVHVFMSPIFLVCFILCLVAGAEFLGLPGVKTMNTVLTRGAEGGPVAVTFDKHAGFRFPFLVRTKDILSRRFEKAQIPLKEKDNLVPSNVHQTFEESIDEAHGNK